VSPSFLRKPAFWIAALVASALCMFLVLRFFGDAFSVLDLDVRMSRDQAIAGARQIAMDRRLLANPATEAAASFSGDNSVQTFVELEGGGKPALKPLLGPDEYSLYRWRVRLFTPGVESEAQVAFTSDGRPAGFFTKIPEAQPGPALSSDAARAIALETATRDWGVDLSRYRALSTSEIVRPGKRVDHEFIYERRKEFAPPVGDGRLRLRLVVAGDRVVQLQRFFYVPEAFARRYEALRSANKTIAAFASYSAGLLYGLGGCLVGVIWLMRRRAVRWAPAMKWAALVAILGAGAGLAGISQSWLDYDTATSASTHLYTRIGGAVIGGVFGWLALTVVFAAAEGLGRLAFAAHPQLWRAWRLPAATSGAIWGRTLAGYAWIGFDLAFIAAFYFVVQTYLGWWSPSDSLIDPNILGQKLPWLAPVATALQAGMMEEALFRAVPIAGAALLGRRFGREKTFIGIALVLQAVIFGCAHATYPGQPAYARPVELFLPSLVWGLVYLRFGLIPGMLFHFGFDLVLMSMPLFVTDVPGLGIDRAIVVAALASPLIVLAIQRIRAGRFVELPASERNGKGFDPALPPAPPEPLPEPPEPVIVAAPAVVPRAWDDTDPAPPARDWSYERVALLLLFALVGVTGIVMKGMRPYSTPVLTITRTQAMTLAEQALVKRGVQLDDRWQRTAVVVTTPDSTALDFVWRQGGELLFSRLIGTVMAPPAWQVRFARYDGDVATRESWRVVVVNNGPPPDGIRLVEHDLPEATPGKRLSEDDARFIAERAVGDWFQIVPTVLRPVGAQSIEKPARLDWVFVYRDPNITLPKDGEVRIEVEVDGDEVVSIGRRVFVPDAWQREQRSRNEILILPRILFALSGLALAIALLVFIVRAIVRGDVSRRAAVVGGLVVATAALVGGVLDLNATQFGFSIAEPYGDQMARVYLRWVGGALGAGLIGALVTGVGVRLASRDALGASVPTRRSARWLASVALALLLLGANGFKAAVTADLGPRFPELADAASALPWLATFVGRLDLVSWIGLGVLLATLLSTRRRWIAIAIAAAFVVVPMLGALSVAYMPWHGVLAAGAIGAVGYLVYRLYFRARLELVATTVLLISILSSYGATIGQPPYRGVGFASYCAIAGAIIGYALWRWLVVSDAAVVTRTSAVTPAAPM